MGFTPKRKVYTLDFEGHAELDGLLMRVSSAPVGQFLDLTSMANKLEGRRGKAITPEEMEKFNALFTGFADALIEWNLEIPAGNPIPPTIEGVRMLDFDHSLEAILMWLTAIADVAPPLGEPSSNGATSAAPPLQMEVLSPSQES